MPFGKKKKEREACVQLGSSNAKSSDKQKTSEPFTSTLDKDKWSGLECAFVETDIDSGTGKSSVEGLGERGPEDKGGPATEPLAEQKPEDRGPEDKGGPVTEPPAEQKSEGRGPEGKGGPVTEPLAEQKPEDRGPEDKGGPVTEPPAEQKSEGRGPEGKGGPVTEPLAEQKPEDRGHEDKGGPVTEPPKEQKLEDRGPEDKEEPVTVPPTEQKSEERGPEGKEGPVTDPLAEQKLGNQEEKITREELLQLKKNLSTMQTVAISAVAVSIFFSFASVFYTGHKVSQCSSCGVAELKDHVEILELQVQQINKSVLLDLSNSLSHNSLLIQQLNASTLHGNESKHGDILVNLRTNVTDIQDKLQGLDDRSKEVDTRWKSDTAKYDHLNVTVNDLASSINKSASVQIAKSIGQVDEQLKNINSSVIKLTTVVKGNDENLKGQMEILKELAKEAKTELNQMNSSLSECLRNVTRLGGELEITKTNITEQKQYIDNVSSVNKKRLDVMNRNISVHATTLGNLTHNSSLIQGNVSKIWNSFDDLTKKYDDVSNVTQDLTGNIEDMKGTVEQQDSRTKKAYDRSIEASSELKLQQGSFLQTTLVGMLLGLLLDLPIMLCCIKYMWQGSGGQGRDESQGHGVDGNRSSSDNSHNPGTSDNVPMLSGSQGLQRSITVIGFYDSTIQRYKQLAEFNFQHVKFPISSYLVTGKDSIAQVPRSKVYLVFVDFNERNVILEDSSLIQGELRTSLVQALLDIKADVFVIYTGERGSGNLPSGSLYNDMLTSVSKHRVLKSLNDRRRVISIDRDFNPTQLQVIEKAIQRM